MLLSRGLVTRSPPLFYAEIKKEIYKMMPSDRLFEELAGQHQAS